MFYLVAAIPLMGAGLYLSAAAWGASLPPWRDGEDRLFLIVPGQFLLLSGVALLILSFGFSMKDVYGWFSDILTHGGGM